MGIVVVNFNYRVGPYGFLSGAEIVKDGNVNNGLKDQIQVLKWVQKHIREVGLLYFHGCNAADPLSSEAIQTMW
jgi:hypothetical protein